jgi:hypothetical protein
VPTRGPLGRCLFGLGLGLGGLLAVAGALFLRGPGLVAVGVAGGVAAILAAGIVREVPGRGRQIAARAAGRAALGTVAVLLVVSGLSFVAGGVVAALVSVAVAAAVLVVWLPRLRRRWPARAAAVEGVAVGPAPVVDPFTALPPVAVLSTSALGREWLRTTTALADGLQPAARAALVQRRQEALDELERRDPDGFARWLSAGADRGSDPAQFVRGDVRGDQAAGTDAA